ncbi:hypothetical protein [Caproiciproducens faecalis]|uniref:Antitoxin VbhA domain-containing protein n=1 Tax=Caproiciproducens faecalis TaxID=2820301 RepID=A0ABS7DN28_9FIRM|nr:hypothetical protein [Caproiciproducens faecalis]MBW7572477.1 hypothetical protein [Caproiciproducens faecalis]
MERSIKINDKNKKNLKSTIASFAVEGITPSRETLKYCRMRDAGRISCKQEIEAVTKKYREMAQR